MAFDGQKLGLAAVAKGRSILGQMIAFGDESIEEALEGRIKEAAALRKKWFDPAKTNAFRVINAEGDGIPCLIVDLYNDVLVLQISNRGIEKFKSLIVKHLIAEFQPRSILEKSTSFLRMKEGLKEERGVLFGEPVEEVEILENGLKFSVDLLHGQKTGLFLDQREMRKLVGAMAQNKKVLNCFAYTGGFSISALAGGARLVDSVEISSKCEVQINKNLELNDLKQNHQFYCEDVMAFIQKSPLQYDLIILDPPAFVKKKEDIAGAFRAYKELNRVVIEKMPSQSILITCSCSYHVSEELFQNILFRASLEAKRKVRILEKHRQAHDHPISIFHPESSYLKSFVLYVC